MGFKNDKSPSRGTVRPTAYKKRLKKSVAPAAVARRRPLAAAARGREGKGAAGVPLGSREGLNSFFAKEGGSTFTREDDPARARHVDRPAHRCRGIVKSISRSPFAPPHLSSVCGAWLTFAVSQACPILIP